MSQLPEKFWSPLEIGDALGFSVFAVRRWIKDGELPAKKIQGQWRTSDTDYKEFLRKKFGAQ